MAVRPLPKLIALDLDGTTLDPTGRPAPATIAAIHRVVEAGIKVVFATGRTYGESRGVIRSIGHTPPSVFAGGANVVDTASGQSLHTHPMPGDTARRLISHIASLGHAALALQDTAKAGRDYWVSHHAPLHRETTDWFAEHDCVWDVHEDLTIAPHEHTIRIGVVDNTALVQAVHASVKALFPAEMLNCHTLTLDNGVSVLECFDPRVNKWLGISQLAADWDIPASDVIGVGDENNDLPMFRSVGLAVAMGNARPQVKEKAHLVIGDNRSDGLAVFLNSIVDGRVFSPTG